MPSFPPSSVTSAVSACVYARFRSRTASRAKCRTPPTSQKLWKFSKINACPPHKAKNITRHDFHKRKSWGPGQCRGTQYNDRRGLHQREHPAHPTVIAGKLVVQLPQRPARGRSLVDKGRWTHGPETAHGEGRLCREGGFRLSLSRVSTRTPPVPGGNGEAAHRADSRGGCHWNISKAAGIPEVNCATFHNKIRKYGLKMGLMMHYCNCNWLKSPKTLGISWMIRSWFRMF